MANHRFLQAALLALPLTIGSLAGAAAQSRPDPAQRPEPAPETVPGSPLAVPPEKIAPPDTRASGTITPPPGSAGGNPTVIPK